MVTVHSAIKPRGASALAGSGGGGAGFFTSATAVVFFGSTDNHCSGILDILEGNGAGLSAPASDSLQIPHTPSRRQPVGLVFCCTILGAAAQVLMKSGANHMVGTGLLGMISNLPLMGGYTLYGISTLLLVLALKDGELSLLYPVIALTYVWVTVLSFLIFHDAINPFKLTGIILIVTGVAVLGKGGRS